MKQVGLFFAFLLVVVLAACGRSAEEVAQVNEFVLTSSAATRAAMPTATTAPTSEAAPAETTGETVAAADAPTGDVARGQTLFNTSFNTSAGQWICANCHSTGVNRLIGPGMAGLAARAGTRVEGETAAQYIVHSIAHPNDYIVPADAGGPYPSGLMPANYADLLTEQDLNDLAAYLLTLQP